MGLYQHVLLALELTQESDAKIIQKAKEIVDLGNVKLSLVHVVEHMVSFGAAYSMPAGIEVEEELVSNAKQMLSDTVDKFSLTVENQIVKAGTAKHVIIEEAKHIAADLIIVGSHGRHGVRLLLGSTANAVLHGAQTDVLAVRVQD